MGYNYVFDILDSVKTITLLVLNSMINPLPHELEGDIINLSKHYGLIKNIKLYIFYRLTINK